MCIRDAFSPQKGIVPSNERERGSVASRGGDVNSIFCCWWWRGEIG